MNRHNTRKIIFASALAQTLSLAPLLLTPSSAHAELGPPLSEIKVPEPPNLKDFVADKRAAIRLGKALFWDMQVGSDGVQACASCHFHAGADNRAKNQLSPGGRTATGDLADAIFDPTASGGGGPNYTLKAADFPFHQFAYPNDNKSMVVFDTNDVASSQGVALRDFVGVTAGNPVDIPWPIPCSMSMAVTRGASSRATRQA